MMVDHSLDNIPENAKPGYVEEELKHARYMLNSDYLVVRGDQIEHFARMLLKYPQDQRCRWFSAAYLDKIDVTFCIYDLSRTEHKLTIEEIVSGLEYQLVDWSGDKSFNSDDLHLLETEIGLI